MITFQRRSTVNLGPHFFADDGDAQKLKLRENSFLLIFCFLKRLSIKTRCTIFEVEDFYGLQKIQLIMRVASSSDEANISNFVNSILLSLSFSSVLSLFLYWLKSRVTFLYFVSGATQVGEADSRM